MNSTPSMRIALCGALLARAFFVPGLAMAAGLEPTAAPSDPASAVTTTDQLYNRLQSGAAGAKRSGAFVEPSAGPADNATKSLDEVMAVAPAADNVNGATPAEVESGKTFWGLRTDGTWGMQTGTGAGSSSSYPAAVPRSGQTTSYVPGDDGDKQKGVVWPSPRFIKNGNGTTTDSLTGLIWLTDANCAGWKNWNEALTLSNALASGQCGLSDGSVAGDWRLPSIVELQGLLDLQYHSPALSNAAGTGKWVEGDPFSGVQSYYCWSSTTWAIVTGDAWYVDLYSGQVNHYGKSNPYCVWPVRGGQ